MTATSIETTALSRIDQARQLRVRDETDYASAGDFLLALRGLRRSIDDTFDAPIAAAHAAHRAAIAAKKKHADKVDEAERIVKREMGRFLKDQEDRRLAHETALEARAQAEAEARRAQEVERLAAAGETVAAAAVAAEPLEVPAVFVPPSVPHVSGISARKTYRAVVTDLLALVAAVASRRVPKEALLANQPFLNAQARDQKQALGWPGVAVEEEQVVVTR